jgi:hypothetical protein
MFGWVGAGLWLFKRFEGRTAIIAGFLVAWGFLPVHTYSLPGLPDYTKISALSYVMMLGVFMYERERLTQFKFHAVDLPVVIFCFSSFCSSLSNGLGAYDGISAMLDKVTEWFIPYFLGRLYFTDTESLRDLCIGLLAGGLAYIPFCMFEWVMSPRLHKMVYGIRPSSIRQARRWGGWRPAVFMQHGLMVGMWMTTASLAGIQLLRTGQLGWLKNTLLSKIKPVQLISILILVSIYCKSTGAIMLLAVGAAVMYFGMKGVGRLPYLALIVIPILYVTMRTNGTWSGLALSDLLTNKMHMPADRVQSMSFRFMNEDILMDKAFQHPLFGWGGWKRSFVFDEFGVPVTVPDGLWIVVLGQNGLVGLSSMLATMMLPQWLYLKRFSPREWKENPLVALGLVAVVLLALYTIDGLINDMFSPLVMVLAGALTGLYLNKDAVLKTADVSAVAEVMKKEPRLL